MVAPEATTQIVKIPRTAIKPGPWQPRKRFDADVLAELADSLRSRGFLAPIKVVSARDGGFLIVAGERRWRASAIAGIAELPCVVIDSAADDAALREIAILDNLHRLNLRPGEEARAVALLVGKGAAPRDVAKGLGKSETWVTQRLAIASLPEAALTRLDNGEITIEEARALSKLSGYPELLDA